MPERELKRRDGICSAVEVVWSDGGGWADAGMKLEGAGPDQFIKAGPGKRAMAFSAGQVRGVRGVVQCFSVSSPRAVRLNRLARCVRVLAGLGFGGKIRG